MGNSLEREVECTGASQQCMGLRVTVSDC